MKILILSVLFSILFSSSWLPVIGDFLILALFWIKYFRIAHVVNSR